jgi:hypothetical protein
MKQVGVVARRTVGRPFLIGLVGVLAVVCASCSGGSEHLADKAASHTADRMVKSDPVTSTTAVPASTTTTTVPAAVPAPEPKSNANTVVPAAQPAPAPAPPATTTTTDPFPPACVWSNFAAKVSTDRGNYAAGQAVQITLEFENTGPACTVNQTGYACPLVNIDNAAGGLVWSSAAPVSTGCATTFTGPTVLAANWSQSFPFTWGQTSCTPGQASCPGPRVAAGQYQVTGSSGGGSSQIPAGAPVTITLAA